MTQRAPRPNGLVRFDRLDRMWYKGADEVQWVAAVRHDDIRDELITRASAQGQYVYPRATGKLKNDITAFHPAQQSWGEARQCRPPILFQFEPRDTVDPDYEVQPMMYKGRVVLDPENHPVRDFREIPATISSAVEGWLMEAIRRMNSNITATDFRARMLRDPSGDGKGKLITVNGVDMRMTRWRQAHRCISWVNRGGSKAFKDHLWGLMTQEMRDNNTTEGLEDVEDEGELARMKLTNQGQYLSRAGSRAIPDHLRERRQRKIIEKAMRFDERQATKQRNEIRKRKRAAPVYKDVDEGRNLFSHPSGRRKVNSTSLNSGTLRLTNTPLRANNVDYPTRHLGALVGYHDTEALRYKPKLPQTSAHNAGLARSFGGNGAIFPGSPVFRHDVPTAYKSTQSPTGAPSITDNINTPIYPSSAATSANTTWSLEASPNAAMAFQLSQNRHTTHPVLDDNSKYQVFNDWLEDERANAHHTHWSTNPNCTWKTNEDYPSQEDFDFQKEDLATSSKLNHSGSMTATNPSAPNNDIWFVEETSHGNECMKGDMLPEVDFDVWTEGRLYHD